MNCRAHAHVLGQATGGVDAEADQLAARVVHDGRLRAGDADPQDAPLADRGQRIDGTAAGDRFDVARRRAPGRGIRAAVPAAGSAARVCAWACACVASVVPAKVTAAAATRTTFMNSANFIDPAPKR